MSDYYQNQTPMLNLSVSPTTGSRSPFSPNTVSPTMSPVDDMSPHASFAPVTPATQLSRPPANSPTPTPIRITLLGPSGSGKTSLATSYLFNVFTSLHIPTLETFYISGLPMYTSDPNPYKSQVLYPSGVSGFALRDDLVLHIQDLGGSKVMENVVRARIAQSDAEVFVLCCSLVDRATFMEIENTWVDMLKARPEVPVVLVGCKKDQRRAYVPVGYEVTGTVMQGDLERVRKRLGWYRSVECSAETEWGMRELWWAICSAALSRRIE